MAWVEKGTPTPFDQQPIAGLYFLDGDLIARACHGLPERWANKLRGHKHPFIHFPSGIDLEVTIDSSTGEVLIYVLQDLALAYHDTRDHAYARLHRLAEPHWLMTKRGSEGLELFCGVPDDTVLITYDNQHRLMVDVALVEGTGDTHE